MPIRAILTPLISSRFSLSDALGKLRQTLMGDTGVTATAMIIQNVIRILGSMVLTRILNAEAFGVVGAITSVLVTFGMLSDIGVTAMVIRHERSQDPVFLDQIWTLRLIRSTVLTALIAIFSWPIARYLGRPDLQWAVISAGMYFLFDGLASLSHTTALRNNQLKRLSAVEIGIQTFGLAMSITLGLIFHSYAAIILANNIAQIATIFVSYKAFPDSRRRWNFSRERVREVWRFSRFITGSTIITLIIGQSDKVVLARAFPLAMFGTYVLAAGLAAAPIGLASAYAGRVLYPRLANIARETPERMKDVFYTIRIRPHLLYGFLVGGLIASGPLVVDIMYDPRYVDAGHYLPILAISSFFIFGTGAVNDVMIATGNQWYSLIANIVRLCYLVIGGIIAFLLAGPVGVVWVVGTIEAFAQVFGWIILWRHGLLRLRFEALILLAGVLGMSVGYIGQLVVHAMFSIH